MPIAGVGGHEPVFGLSFLKPLRDLIDRALQSAMQQFVAFRRPFDLAESGAALTVSTQREGSIAKQRERI